MKLPMGDKPDGESHAWDMCGICGGAFVLVSRDQYGCATHKDRGDAVCSNALKVKRQIVEEALLSGIKKNLLARNVFELFEQEVVTLLGESQPNPIAAKRRLAKAEERVANLISAIADGIRSPSTKTALDDAEEEAKLAKLEIEELQHFDGQKMLSQARKSYEDLVATLESLENVGAARDGPKRLTRWEGEISAD